MRLIRNVLILGLLLVSRGLVAQELRIVPPVQLGLAPDRLDQIVSLVEEAVSSPQPMNMGGLSRNMRPPVARLPMTKTTL